MKTHANPFALRSSWIKDIATILRTKLGDRAKKVPTRTVPNFVIRIVGLWDPAVGLIVSELGKAKRISNAKAKSTLDWHPRSTEEAVVSCAESLEKFGLVKK